MSQSDQESDETGEESPGGEHAGKRTGQRERCQRCGREQGLVSKYDIWLCRQCFREIARSIGFRKYR